jgi:MYXO-CTERM domain-containing protein
MTTSYDRSRLRLGRHHALAALFALAMTASLPTAASAQGRCSCNNGCHQYPGQCVQPGSSACEAGFAPFCETRASSCPNVGWVSCGGACTCVRISPLDAGTPTDVPASVDTGTPTDVPASMDTGTPMDAPPPRDVPASMDLGFPVDAPMSMDARPPVDVPASMDARAGSDVLASMDVPAGSDAPVSVDVRPSGDAPPGADAPLVDRPVNPPDSSVIDLDGGSAVDAPAEVDAGATASDAAASTDGCVCEGGICVGGVCYRERCTYHPELGFICAAAGTSCRLTNGTPICVPICAGVSCAAGEFCDERSNGVCVADRCASIQCPIGTTCRHNQCGRWSGDDGGTFLPEDGGVFVEDGGAGAPPTATDDGCGCRAGQVGAPGGPWGALLLGLLGLGARRRRRSA